jgi:hypothetical protein
MKQRAVIAPVSERAWVFENGPPTEPEEEDLITSDHRHFFYIGSFHRGAVVSVPEGEDWRPHILAFMQTEQFYPNVWFISDHGNSHILSLEA